MGKVLIVFPGIHPFHSRIRKIAESFARKGFEVECVSAFRSPSDRMHSEFFKIHYSKGYGHRSIDWLSFICLILTLLYRNRYDILSLNSVSVLPFVAVAQLKGKTEVIYAPHELEWHKNSLNVFSRQAAKILELCFIHKVDRVIVVGHIIARLYCLRYGLDNCSVCRNIPDIRSVDMNNSGINLVETLEVKESLVGVYWGILANGRGLERVIEYTSSMNDVGVIFVGFGNFYGSLEGRQNEGIYVSPAMEMGSLFKSLAGIDFGFCLIEPTCMSYYFSLPNKAFEYITASLPVAMSDLPELEKLNSKYRFGEKVDDIDSFRNFLSKIRAGDFLKGIKTFNEHENWEKEFETAWIKY
jgi:hypothetical protein